MWIETYHRFASRAAFLAACDDAGWERDPLDAKRPLPPPTVGIHELGPLVARPTMDDDGNPIPGDVIDPRFHVNAAWANGVCHEAFAASRVEVATPARTFGFTPPPPPPPPVVPAVIPSWKAKDWLRQQGKLAAAEAVAVAAGGTALMAWQHASEWHRDGALVGALAGALMFTEEDIDAAFVAADAIKG